MDVVHLEAARRGCRCLSTYYISLTTLMLWQCEKMHLPWEATFKSFRGKGTSTKSKCPGCIPPKKILTINDAHETADKHGGKCLSTEYKNNYTHLLWKCEKSYHEPWWATLGNVMNGNHWCAPCAHEKTAHNIEFARQVATQKGGYCLSNEYHNNREKLVWKCRTDQHPIFEMTLHDVLGNH